MLRWSSETHISFITDTGCLQDVIPYGTFSLVQNAVDWACDRSNFNQPLQPPEAYKLMFPQLFPDDERNQAEVVTGKRGRGRPPKSAEVEDLTSYPERVNNEIHAHELTKTSCTYDDGRYTCDVCSKPGQGWVYVCSDCNFDAHLFCAWKNDNNDDANANEKVDKGGTEPIDQHNSDDDQVMSAEGGNDTINILLSITGMIKKIVGLKP